MATAGSSCSTAWVPEQAQDGVSGAAAGRDENVHCVAVLGDTFVDLYCPLAEGQPLPFFGGDVLLRDGVSIKSGGSASNTAVHLASLVQSRPGGTTRGLKREVSFHTALGSDSFADIVRGKHARVGSGLVAASMSEEELAKCSATGTCVVISGSSDRAFMSSHGVMDLWHPQHLDIQKLQRANHLHIGGYHNFSRALQDGLPAIVEQLRAKRPSLLVSLDIGYDASNQWGYEEGNPESNRLLELLKHVDVFLPNEEEARGLSRQSEDSRAVSWLVKRVRPSGVVVLTCGPKGAVYQSTTDDAPQLLKAPKVDFKDSTGAGDAFNAAFLYAFVFEQKPLNKCVVYGLLGGSLAVMYEGACDTPLTTELLDY